jgi:hypothetical protein
VTGAGGSGGGEGGAARACGSADAAGAEARGRLPAGRLAAGRLGGAAFVAAFGEEDGADGERSASCLCDGGAVAARARLATAGGDAGAPDRAGFAGAGAAGAGSGLAAARRFTTVGRMRSSTTAGAFCFSSWRRMRSTTSAPIELMWLRTSGTPDDCSSRTSCF